MQSSLNSEQQLLQDSLRRFLNKEYGFESRQALISRHPGGSSENWDAFSEQGWLAAALPEDVGGFGGTIVDVALIAHEFGRALVVEPYVGCAVLAAQTLLAGGSPEQIDSIMPAVAEGRMQLALAYSEPASRGMSSPVSTTAQPTEAGYVINGKKSLVLGSGQAKKIIVSAALAGTGEVRLFLVDADAPNLIRTPLPLHDGTLAEEHDFNGVSVPAENMLAGDLSGQAALKKGLAYGIIALCSGLVGAMERAIEITAEYLKTRQQFGKPISSFQSLQHRMADMAAEMELARSMLLAAMAAVDSGPADARDRAVSHAKTLVGRAAKFVCGQAIQLHGGIGMTDEYVIGHYFKHAVVADALFGSSNRHEAEFAATLTRECAEQDMELVQQ